MVENKDMEELKDGWKKVKLGEVVSIRRGSSPRPIKNYVVEKGMPWVKIADATESKSKYINSTKEFIKLEGISKSVIVEKGDLIFSNSGTAGIPWFMGITACIHDGWQVFRDFNGISKEFLYFTLINIRHKLLHNANDSTMKNLTLDMVRDFELNLPPLETQQKIASILSSLDDKIELNNEMNKTLEEMAQTLFKRWFIDFEFPNENGEPYRSSGGKMVQSELGEIPEEWEVKELGDFFKFIKGKKPKITSESYSEETPMKYLTIKGFTGDENLFASTNKIVSVEKNDIVMVMDGASSGTIYIGKKGVLGSTFAKIEKKIELEWSYLYSILKYFENKIKEHTTGSAIPHTDKVYVEKLKVIIPKDILFLNKLAQTVKGIIEKNIQQQEEIITLTKLRDTLLPKLMNGEVEI